DKLNLAISANTCVAILGITGSGKTTILDLLLSLLKPNSGSLYVDDIKINDDNQIAWQENIGYVPQSIFLVDDT
ncbi:MAG: ATP-binding cassette domain-containing protein, partial [Candidatus Dadabacteria bacterium]|nr:ATP-binding cassette domain-containing protein [Candidatus Dadabacteria bacterium]